MLNILAERSFPADEVVALASRKSVGVEASYRRQDPQSEGARAFRFFRRRHLPDVGGRRRVEGMVAEDRRARRGGDRQFVGVADGSRRSADRAGSQRDALDGFAKKNIIANPNCSTAQLVVALKPLHDKATIKRVVVSTYQSVSGAGKEAMDELFSQTKAVFTLARSSRRSFRAASLSTSFRRSTSSWKTATPRKSGR